MTVDAGQQDCHRSWNEPDTGRTDDCIHRYIFAGTGDFHGSSRKNEVDMAVGNAVGSNIFNILMVLGIASAINPVSMIRENMIDILVLVGFSLVVWVFAATKKKIFSRREGLIMIVMYLAYAVYIINR